MAKVKIHPSTATREDIIATNGIAILDSIVKDIKITEEFNGDFFAELNFATNINVLDQKIYDYITEEVVLTVEDEFGDEYFRISNIRKDKYNIYVFARQITIADQLTLFLKDSRPENMNGQACLSKIYNDSTGRNKLFFLESNLSNQATAYYQNMSLYNALFNADNAFTVRWGGEVYRRGFNCKINDKVGEDRGVQIKSRKNLTGFEIKSNIDDLATRIVPRGFDGIEAPIVESPLINSYSSVYTKVMEFSDIKVKSENNPDEGYDTLEQAQQALTERAKQQFTLFNVDKIQAEYNIKFIELSRTEQYKEFEIAETVNMGDTVEVIEETYGTKIKARCIKRIYSPTLGRRLETTLSNVKKESRPISVNDIIAELEKELQTKPNANLSDYINSMINAGLKDSYVVLRPNELLIMDNKDLTKAVNVTRYNKNGLGFSTTGYYGKYEYGFTIDGKINASLITFGAMSGQYIKAGSIEADRLTVSAINEIKDSIKGDFVTKTDFSVEVGKINASIEEKTRDKVTETQLNLKVGELTAKVSETSPRNLVDNSSFESGNVDWNIHKLNWNSGTAEVFLDETDNYMLNGATGARLQSYDPVNGGEYGIYQTIKVNQNTNYRVSCLIAQERINKSVVLLADSVNGQWVTSKVIKGNHSPSKDPNTWVRVELEFFSYNYTKIDFRVQMSEGADTNGFLWITKVMFNEGEIALPWTPRAFDSTFVEQKLTPTSIINSVNKGLTEGGAISVASTILDENGFSQLNNNKLSVRLNNNGIHIYSFLNEGLINGSLQALKNISTGENSATFSHESHSFSSIDYKKQSNDNYVSYVMYDKFSKVNLEPITYYENQDLNGTTLYLGKKAGNGSYLFGWRDSQGRGSSAWYTRSFYLMDSGSNNSLFTIDPDNAYFGTNSASFKRNLTVLGDLNVSGNKNCIQQTKFGNIPFYANEDINSLLTETDTDTVYTTELVEDKYICRIEIDELIQECINTELPYNVYIDKLGWGDYKVEVRKKDYFIVESDRVLKFKYKLEGRRKGFESENKYDNFMSKNDIPLPPIDINEVNPQPENPDFPISFKKI